MKIKPFLPLIIFALIAVFLLKGLHRNPSVVPSPLIGKPVPSFTSSSLKNPSHPITEKIFQGHVTVLNVFASWCLYCKAEHPVMMDIAASGLVQLVGIDYKDNPPDAKRWLKQYGNPYKLVILDPHGKVAMNFGVYGTPETFLIDAKGIIRYKHVGAMSSAIWQEKLLPLVKKLRVNARSLE